MQRVDKAASAFRPRDAALLAALIFLVGLGAVSFDLGAPDHIYFDETWYVPAGRTWLATGENLHPEHPPLAKMLIGSGMAIFGDEPFGWRFMNAVFGAVTLVAMFAWGLALFEDLKAALWIAAITAFNQILYVQSRIAMLDGFMFAFVTLGLAAVTYALKTQDRTRGRLALLAGGMNFGLAGACKISGFFTLLGVIGLMVMVLGARDQRRREPEHIDFSAPATFAWIEAALALVLVPLLVYAAVYLPQAIRHGSLGYIIDAQREMFRIMLGHSATHPYSSLWYSWPVEGRPVWYLFDIPGGEAKDWSEDNPAAAVVALANPLLLIAGQFAVIVALGRAFARLQLESLIVVVAYFAQWLPWTVNPKGLEFDYYFFPSVLCLGPALALLLLKPQSLRGDIAAALFLALTAGMFVFFLPVLSADFNVSPAELDLRTWASSWR